MGESAYFENLARQEAAEREARAEESGGLVDTFNNFLDLVNGGARTYKTVRNAIEPPKDPDIVYMTNPVDGRSYPQGTFAGGNIAAFLNNLFTPENSRIVLIGAMAASGWLLYKAFES